jgi:hypothetical protein
LGDIVEEFYKVVFRDPGRRVIKFRDSIQPEMIVKSLPYNQIEWRLLPWSETIPPEFELIEKAIGYQLPEIYKTWFSRYYRLGAGSSSELIGLIEAPPDGPFSPLHYHLKKAWGGKLLDGGLITIGHGLDEVCLDATRPRDDGDYPIVVWFHEDGFRDKARGGIYATIFSSFQKLLECVAHYFAGDEDNWEDRLKRTQAFFDIDPEGAGGKDRWYWETHMEG